MCKFVAQKRRVLRGGKIGCGSILLTRLFHKIKRFHVISAFSAAFCSAKLLLKRRDHVDTWNVTHVAALWGDILRNIQAKKALWLKFLYHSHPFSGDLYYLPIP